MSRYISIARLLCATLFLFMMIALCLSVLAQPVYSNAGEKEEDALIYPHNEGNPVQIEILLEIIDITEINGLSETFALDSYMILRWKDDTSTSTPQVYWNEAAQEKLGEVLPYLELNHRYETREIMTSRLEVFANGDVMYSERFHATLYSPFDLRSFPFDSQEFLIQVEAFHKPIQELQFTLIENIPDNDYGAPGLLYYTDSLEPPKSKEWKIEKTSSYTEIFKSPYTGNQYSHAVFLISAKRLSGFYVWKVFLPLIIILAISWSVFWMHGESTVIPRVSISMLGFLTTVSFGFFVGSNLPKVSYLTFMDSFLIGIYILVFLAVVEVLTTGFLIRTGREAGALLLNLRARWAFSVALLIYILVISLIFLY